MRRLLTLLPMLALAMLVAACGGSSSSTPTSSSTSPSMTTVDAAAVPAGELSASEYALAEGIQSTGKADAEHTDAARAKLCGRVATTFRPQTPLIRNYAAECRALVQQIAAGRGFQSCTRSLPDGITQVQANADDLRCNVTWYPRIAQGDVALVSAIRATGRTLTARGIATTSRCGEIFALGPGALYNASRQIAPLRKVAMIARRVLRSKTLVAKHPTAAFLSNNDAVGKFETAFGGGVDLPDEFAASVCRHVAS